MKAEPDFGVKIPAQPQLMLDMEQARGLLHRRDASLVSIRSWPEFIGTTSGYSYIKPKGEIAGARWGHAGSDSTHMEDFHNPDGTMRSADDITAMWKAWNIKPDQQVSFYCGTGWRASETFMYARAMGWNNVSVYDGGWYEWSSDPKIRLQPVNAARQQQITLQLLTLERLQRQIPTPHPRKGRHPAQRTEDPRKPRKPCRE